MTLEALWWVFVCASLGGGIWLLWDFCRYEIHISRERAKRLDYPGKRRSH